MKLLNLNIGININNTEDVIDLIRQDNYDIVTLQEVMRGIDKSVYKQYNNIEYLKQKTKYKYNFFGPLWIANYQEKNGVITKDFGGFTEQGNSILSNHKIKNSSNCFYYKDYSFFIDTTNFKKEDHPRSIIDSILSINGKELQIICVHGIWNENKIGDKRTIAQSNFIISKIRTDIPCIVVGDFNLLPETESIKIINSKLTNLIEKYNIKTTRPTSKNDIICDYIFVNEKIKVKNFKILNCQVSDHLPLILDFDMEENMNEHNNNKYEEICPTALVTSYPRMFTDIPYEKEISKWLDKNGIISNTQYKDLAPEIEARYKLINKILDKSKIKQVLELASGYSSRGLIYSQKGYKYVELDLEPISKNKRQLVNHFLGTSHDNLIIQSGNALNESDFDNVKKYLTKEKEVAIINEGLLRYLTFAEKRIIATNIYNLLNEFGGIWITSDVTPKKFIASQDNALPNFNKDLDNITSRNNLQTRFEDINHVKTFFGNIGFEVIEVHKFNEIQDELYSVNKLNIINDNIKKTLDDAIVVVMQVKR